MYNHDLPTLTAENLSWNDIDREPSDWQYVCQMNLPYWWSSKSKYTRLKKIQPRCAPESSPGMRREGIEQGSNMIYAERRRVMSDGYLTDACAVQDLAHLVAIQLLGACFTLPPDHVPISTDVVEHGNKNVPNPQMVSSLRLHTSLRYSPYLDYQARSPSPAQHWPGTFDGPSTIEPLSPSDDSSDPLSVPHQKFRTQLTLEIPEESGLLNFETLEHESFQTDVYPKAGKSWYRRHGIRDFNSRAFKRPPPSHNSKRLTRKPHTSNPPKYETDRQGVDTQHQCHSSEIMPVTDDNQQATILHSEPHRIFIRPMKERVSRRWSRFRRRIGGSLHTDDLTSESEDQSSASEASAFNTPNCSIGKSARTRSQRVQERGDIETSSMEDSPHYNSPMSGNLSPVEIGQGLLWRKSRSLSAVSNPRLAERFNEAAALAAAEYHIPVNPNRHRQSLVKNTNEYAMLQVSPVEHTASMNAAMTTTDFGVVTSELCDCHHPEPSSPSSMAPAFRTPSRASTRGRDRRKSMLSEICTPDEYADSKKCHKAGCPEGFDRGSLSIAGSALVSPQEETEAPSFLHLAGELNQAVSPGHGEMIGGIRGSMDQSCRPKLPRTSTSGTQIFTPDPDGIEIDGLPVGPGMEAWSIDGKRRERTYL